MISDSSNVSPVFIQEAPDWSKPVVVSFDFLTTIAEARNEGRQRARWRKQPRYSISYEVPAQTLAEFTVRRAAIIGELRAPLVCPIWTDWHELDSVAGNNFTLTASVTKKKFKVNSYAYIVQGDNKAFRKITGIAGAVLTFQSGTFPTFTAGATVYPCIVGFRPKDGNAFTQRLPDSTDEAITVEEL